MITPTTSDASAVDIDAIGSFTEFLVEGGVHGLFPCGSLGEFSSLTREQRSTIIETVVAHTEDVPVLAGCGGTSVKDVQNFIADAAAAGADAAVVVTPYYLHATDQGLMEFYDRLLAETPLPIVLYDIPSLTGNEFSVKTVAELATRENVIGIKDSTNDLTHHQRLIEATPSAFQVLQGMTGLAIPSLDIGADGFVAGPANVYPDALSRIADSYRQDNRSLAVELWQHIANPIVAATKPHPTTIGLKYLLKCRERDMGPPLPPLSRPSEADRNRLDECYQQVSSRLQTPIT